MHRSRSACSMREPPREHDVMNDQAERSSTARELLVLAWPMVVSQGAFALMIFTDRFFLSMVSPVHMGASLGGGVASYFCMALFIGALSYANALVAQYFGQQAFARCARVLTQGLLLCAASWPLLLALGYLVVHLFTLMGHAPDQIALEERYFMILIHGAVVMLVKTCFASYFSGIGRTRYVMVADVLSVALNIPLTWLLVFGAGPIPALGIAGAAWATVASGVFAVAVFGALYCAPEHLRRFEVRASLRLDAGILRRWLRLGVPAGVEAFLNVAAFNLFLLMFQSYGVAESASAAIVFNWDILSFVPMLGLNVAIISLVGRYVGAGDSGRMQEVVRAGFTMGLGYSSVLAVIFLLARVPLVELFLGGGGDDAAIITLASTMMIGLAAYTMADAIILIVGGVLRGAGDTRWLMWASIVLHWMMLVVQVFVIEVWELGARVSWLVFVIAILSTAAVYSVRLYRGRWNTQEALARVLSEH